MNADVGISPLRQSGLSLEIVINDTAWPASVTSAALASRVASAISRFIVLEGPEVAVAAFSDDTEVQALNARFRGKDKPTNVLSFPAHLPEIVAPLGEAGAEAGLKPKMLGDIILARQTVCAEAEGQHIPLEHHVCHLMIHGILHLMGYDHDAEDAAEDMETLETEILAVLDIPNPYTEELVDAG